MRPVYQTRQEICTLGGNRGFIGNRPYYYVGTVAVAGHLVLKLRGGIGVSLRVRPVNRPIDRNFAPYHDAHLLSKPDHIFVVRIMRQPQEVAAHRRRFVQQRLVLFAADHPAAIANLLLVHCNAFAEYLLVIEQQLFALCTDETEADIVIDLVFPRSNADSIEFRGPRAPQHRGSVEAECPAAVGTDLDSHRFTKFRDGDDGFLYSRTVKLHPAIYFIAFSALADLDRIIAYECLRLFDNAHATGNASIIPPVSDVCRNCIFMAGIVHHHYERVAAIAQRPRNFDVERGEAA